jgi:hypothetical protein
MEHVFSAGSESVSVEVALKLALQFQAASGRPGRQRFLTVRGGYLIDASNRDHLSGLAERLLGAIPTGAP